MAANKPIIEPERIGLWLAVTFILALLALVTAAVGLKRVWEATAITQAEIVVITNRINDLQKKLATPPVAPAVAAPAADAAPAAPAAPPESK